MRGRGRLFVWGKGDCVCGGGGGRASVGRGRGRLCVWGGEGLVLGYKGVWVGGGRRTGFFISFSNSSRREGVLFYNTPILSPFQRKPII